MKTYHIYYFGYAMEPTQLAFYINLQRAVIGPLATPTGRERPAIDLCSMLTGKWYSGLYVPRQGKTCIRAYVDNDGPDHPAHPHSLFRTFTIRKQTRWILQNA